MMKNYKLKTFYNKVYKKGENQHFTLFVTKGTTTNEIKEVLKELSWKTWFCNSRLLVQNRSKTFFFMLN